MHTPKYNRKGNRVDIHGLMFVGKLCILIAVVVTAAHIALPQTLKDSVSQQITHAQNQLNAVAETVTVDFLRPGDAQSASVQQAADTTSNEKAAITPQDILTSVTDVPRPRIAAKSYVVGNITTGDIYASKAGKRQLPIASITKLMTALLAQDMIDSNSVIPITERAVATYGEQGGLSAGESMTFSNIIYPLLLESSNDAAEAIAEYIGRAHFMQQMNRKARGLGMHRTIFDDPSGLSQFNRSTAEDLFVLSRHVHSRAPLIFDITASLQETVPQENSVELRNFTNNNPFKSYPDFVGGKNGYTDEARKTLLSLFDVTVGDTTQTIAVIVLGTETHVTDTKKLLGWFENGVYQTLAERSQ